MRNASPGLKEGGAAPVLVAKLPVGSAFGHVRAKSATGRAHSAQEPQRRWSRRHQPVSKNPCLPDPYARPTWAQAGERPRGVVAFCLLVLADEVDVDDHRAAVTLLEVGVHEADSRQVDAGHHA